MDGKTSGRRPAVCRSWRIDSKGEWRLLCIVWGDQIATETFELDIRSTEESCLVRQVIFSGPSHPQAYANTPISTRKTRSLMHSWTETSRWRRYYGVTIFMEYIEANTWHTTIPDVSALDEHRYKLSFHIHDNWISDGVTVSYELYRHGVVRGTF